MTLFGQSAGGASVCDAAVSPTAAGLFENGISESGFYNYLGQHDLVNRGLQVQTADRAPGPDSRRLVRGQGRLRDRCRRRGLLARRCRCRPLINNGGQILNPTAGGTIGPTINGTTLPMSAAKAFILGRLNNIRLVIGVARDEFNGGL